MADPLSITASIIAVLQLSKSVVSYIHAVKDASKESRKLLLDVQYVQGLLEILSETLQNVKIVANWDSTLQVLNRSDNPLSALRAVFLELKSKFNKASTKHGAERVLASLLWPLTKKETDDTSRVIERQKTLLLIALDNDHLLLSAEIKKDTAAIRREVGQITSDVRTVSTTLAAIQLSSEDVKVKSSLDWLSKLTYQSTQDEIYRQRLPDSLNWFLERPEFLSWVAGSSKTLFCSGIPGAGKTVVAATVIQHLFDKFHSSKADVGIAWLYCTFRARQVQTPLQMLASIAAQLVRQRADLKYFVTNMTKDTDNEPTQHDISTVLAQCKAAFTTIYIVIDALDEYSEDSDGWLPFLQQLKETGLDPSLLVTARPIAIIEKEFAIASRIEIVAKQTDILAYTRNELLSIEFQKYLSTDEELRIHLEKAVLEKCQGMFLLTKLHMEAIRQKAKYNKRALRKAVDELPKKLDATFDLTFQRITSQNSDDAELALQVIAWVYHSFEDLPMEVIQQALACQRGDDVYDIDSRIDADFLLSVCAGLVTLNSETKNVRLIHTTVAEYLDRHFHEIYPNAALNVHHTCLKHMLRSGLLQKLMDVRSFSGDSQWWWYELQDPREERESEREGEYSRCRFSRYAQRHVSTLDEPHLIFVSWMNILHHAYNLILRDCCETEDATTDLPLAVFLGDRKGVERLLPTITNQGSEECTSSRTLSRYLAFSILRGHEEIARLLLDAGADVQAKHVIEEELIGSVRGHITSDCLSLAIRTGNDMLVELIQKKKAESV